MLLIKGPIRDLLVRYKEIAAYVFFGGLTTLVNLLVFALAGWAGMGTFGAVTLAWVLAVVFAYLTNRRWVFKSTAKGAKNILSEAAAFFSLRAGTYFLDLGIVWIFVEVLLFNSTLQSYIVKFGATVLVVIANYLFSKFFVFRK